MLHFVLWLAYLIDSSKAIKVGGKQNPYKMWQAGISLAASPLVKSLAGEAREVKERLSMTFTADGRRQTAKITSDFL